MAQNTSTDKVMAALAGCQNELDAATSKGDLQHALSSMAGALYEASSLFENTPLFTGHGAVDASDPISIYDVRDVLSAVGDLKQSWVKAMRKG